MGANPNYSAGVPRGSSSDDPEAAAGNLYYLPIPELDEVERAHATAGFAPLQPAQEVSHEQEPEPESTPELFGTPRRPVPEHVEELPPEPRDDFFTEPQSQGSLWEAAANQAREEHHETPSPQDPPAPALETPGVWDSEARRRNAARAAGSSLRFGDEQSASHQPDVEQRHPTETETERRQRSVMDTIVQTINGDRTLALDTLERALIREIEDPAMIAALYTGLNLANAAAPYDRNFRVKGLGKFIKLTRDALSLRYPQDDQGWTYHALHDISEGPAQCDLAEEYILASLVHPTAVGLISRGPIDRTWRSVASGLERPPHVTAKLVRQAAMGFATSIYPKAGKWRDDATGESYREAYASTQTYRIILEDHIYQKIIERDDIPPAVQRAMMRRFASVRDMPTARSNLSRQMPSQLPKPIAARLAKATRESGKRTLVKYI